MSWMRYFQAPWLLSAAVVLPILFVTLTLAWARRRQARVARLATPEQHRDMKTQNIFLKNGKVS